MLHFISWSQFIDWTFLGCLAYYVIVCSLYYRKEILTVFNPSMKIESPVKQDIIRSESPTENTIDLQPEIPFATVHDLLEELKTVFQHKAKGDVSKKALLDNISSKLKEFPTLKGSDVREDIDMHICLEAKDKCAIDLTDEDLQQI